MKKKIDSRPAVSTTIKIEAEDFVWEAVKMYDQLRSKRRTGTLTVVQAKLPLDARCRHYDDISEVPEDIQKQATLPAYLFHLSPRP